MLKIGQFSRFSHVTVKTLRYYDKIGLLKPAEIDRFTGYRYYSASQLPRLHRILALKDLGLSLEQIGDLLEGDLSPEQIRGILRMKQTEIQQQVAEEQARLARVEQRLKQIELEEAMPTQEVLIKKVPALTVASVRDSLPVAGLQQLFGELFGYLSQRGLGPVGPPIAIYYDEEFHEGSIIDAEITAPVAGPVPEGDRIKLRELPAIKQAASIIHEGSYEDVSSTYSQLLQWIETNGCCIIGPFREVYLQGPEADRDPSTYVTEIQFPVEKA
ncbi:MAG: MerR family transcriptional regulator [Chloroflexi bacterium]|nr:MerR family transcriptional regulator [Chloroflexota bacterium]